jgi:PD-(D/E)XK nuclease superfamily
MELEDLMNESIEIMEDDFYKKPFQFSYSSLNKLMWSPAVFYQLYVLGNKEEKLDAHLVHGKLIHGLLLEPEKFNEQFIVSPDNLPTGNPKMVIDRVFAHHQELAKHGDQRSELEQFDDAVLDVMKDMNYHQNLKTDQQRLDKILTADCENYWNFLKSKGNKTLIDQQSYEFCLNAVELIKTDKSICKLIGCNPSEFDNVEVLNELPLECKIKGRPFGLKGIVDNLVIDHDQKIVYINDVKTSSKDLKDFPETVDYYNYWMQAAIYTSLVVMNYPGLIDQGYDVKFNFVVIDKNYLVYPFEVRDSTLHGWLEKLDQVFAKAEWHYINKRYDLPYEFATGKISL